MVVAIRASWPRCYGNGTELSTRWVGERALKATPKPRLRTRKGLERDSHATEHGLAAQDVRVSHNHALRTSGLCEPPSSFLSISSENQDGLKKSGPAGAARMSFLRQAGPAPGKVTPVTRAGDRKHGGRTPSGQTIGYG